MRKICVLASSNKDKIREMQEIFGPFGFELKAASEMGPALEVEENADTFAGNALLKVEAYRELYPSCYILADDSGLCIDALGGAPGVYSARFAGEDSDYEIKSREIWRQLRETGIPEEGWTAHFFCAVAFWAPDEENARFFEGKIEGRIIPERKGIHGFGYDPIFFLDEYGMTSAEIDPDVKNRISHRAKALQKLEMYLKEKLEFRL